jgi:hypothetical protein
MNVECLCNGSDGGRICTLATSCTTDLTQTSLGSNLGCAAVRIEWNRCPSHGSPVPLIKFQIAPNLEF